MGIYSSIDRKINGDAWFRGLSHMAQLLWFRLLTGSHVTPVAGLWAANEEGLARSFGFTIKEFREAFAETSSEPASNGLPRVISDWNAGLIWVPNSIEMRCNQPPNSNVLKSWGEYVELLPECELKTKALQYLRTWVEQHRNRYGSVPTWLETCSAMVSRQEQEQEQEQEQCVDATPKSRPARAKRNRNTEPAVPLAADWRPSEKSIQAMCEKYSCQTCVILAHVGEFVVYWRDEAGKGTLKRPCDWESTYRKRIEQLAGWGRLHIPSNNGRGAHHSPPQPNNTTNPYPLRIE